MKVSINRSSIKLQRERDNEHFVPLMILIVAVYSFFGYLLPKTYQYSSLVIVVIGLLFYSVLKGNKIKSEHIRIIVLLIAFAALLLLMAFYSAFPETSIKSAINIGAILGIGVFLTTQHNWYDKCLKYLLLFSIVHVLFTLFSYVNPNAFINIVLPLLPGEISSASSLFMTYDLYAGITDQIARNAFYITVGISIMVTALITKSKKVSLATILTLTLMIIALLLTGKRGHLVSNIIALLVVIVVYAKVQGKSIVKKLLIAIIAVSFLVIAIIMIVPEAATPFMRFMVGGGDITSGRTNLYVFAIELFKQKPILGWGFGSFSVFQETGTHNVYLQLLCETGVVGTVLFVSILLSNILVTFKAIRKYCSFNKIVHDRFLLFSLYTQVFYIAYAMTGNPLNDGFILIVYMIAMSIPHAMSLPKGFKLLNNYNSLIDHSGTKAEVYL